MRKRQTFLLTILTAENEEASFCGRLKVISSGKTLTFASLDELYRLIASEMDEDALQQLIRRDLTQNNSKNRVPASR